MKAVGGDDSARRRLDDGVSIYNESVEVAKSIAKTAKEIAPGMVLVDVCDKPLYDPRTLNALLEAYPGARITAVRKSLGPIAAVHGIQYSLSVPKPLQATIDLRKLVPGEAASDPNLGIISNVSFLLHVSEDVWNRYVIPRYRHDPPSGFSRRG